jgi:predicted dehydrogenase
VRTGVIGCGKISGAYFQNAKNFPILDIVACADLNPEAAKTQATAYNIPKACTVKQLLADPEIELVINLTVPKAHVPVALKILAKGKHTFSEKPLGISRREGRKLLAAAEKTGLKIGCAPDTFLGAGIQTARQLIDQGAIGKPLAFTAFFMCPGHESWHPSPEFYYQVGGGPMFDMGPYYLTALLNLLGPIQRLSGMATIAQPQRTITSQPKSGQVINVETPDHVVGNIQFVNGCVGTLVTSFATRFPTHDGKQPITIFGEEATPKVPDPNQFDGPVSLRKKGETEWREMPHTFVKGYGRSVGAADMAYAIRSGRSHRANLQQAFTVLDLMQGFLDSSKTGRVYTPAIPYERPAAMPAQLPFGTLDE